MSSFLILADGPKLKMVAIVIIHFAAFGPAPGEGNRSHMFYTDPGQAAAILLHPLAALVLPPDSAAGAGDLPEESAGHSG